MGGQSFENQRVKRIVFLGSSKGGYSALNFAFLIPGATVIIGAPQYYLGSYLDKKDTKVNLQYLIGDITEANKERLNIRLKNRIATSEIKPECIYFHYSNVEHTYKEHIKDMLADLNSAGVRVIEDVQKYPNHGDLKDFYPLFLGEKLNELLKE